MKQFAWLCLAGWLSNGVVQAQSMQAQLPPLNASQLLRLQGIRPTANGLVLLMNGNPQVRMERVVQPDRVVIDLSSTAIPTELHRAVIPINQFGVKQARVAQFDRNITRIVLDLMPGEMGEWLTRFDPNSGLVIQPALAAATAPAPTVAVPRGIMATLQGFTVEGNTRLVIQADQSTTFTATNDPNTNTFNLVVSPAQVSPNWQRSVLAADVPIERVRVTQVNDSVVASFQLSPGWRMEQGRGGSFNQIVLQLTQIRPPAPPPPPLPQVLPPTSQAPVPNRGRRVVVVDPGHGGRDPGAVGNGILEKDVVLQISLITGRELQRLGYVVHYTRTSDIELDLTPRVALAERVNADAFVSIHANSLASRAPHVRGIETFFAPGAHLSRLLAEQVQNEMIEATGANDRGVKSARFYVIRNTTMPSVLAEVGFITSPQESAKLNTPAYQQRLGEAIARGVHQFLSRQQAPR